MKSVIYYVRDDNNHPKISICLAVEGDEVARGMAICSSTDNVKKSEGRKRAYDRAIEALSSKQNKEQTNLGNIAIKTGLLVKNLPEFKSEYMPKLFSFEKKLLARVRE